MKTAHYQGSLVHKNTHYHQPKKEKNTKIEGEYHDMKGNSNTDKEACVELEWSSCFEGFHGTIKRDRVYKYFTLASGCIF